VSRLANYGPEIPLNRPANSKPGNSLINQALIPTAPRTHATRRAGEFGYGARALLETRRAAVVSSPNGGLFHDRQNAPGIDPSYLQGQHIAPAHVRAAAYDAATCWPMKMHPFSFKGTPGIIRTGTGALPPLAVCLQRGHGPVEGQLFFA